MPDPSGFEFRREGSAIAIFHNGRRVTVLRGWRAIEFERAVDDGDEQQLMARLTGNYKRGNERLARSHPRHANRGR